MKIMNAEEYKHTWVLPHNAWYIKFFIWMWMADVSDVTFCKLFWGYSLAWFGIPVRLSVYLITFLIKLPIAFNRFLASRPLESPLVETVKVKKSRSYPRMKQLLTLVENAFTRLNMFVQNHDEGLFIAMIGFLAIAVITLLSVFVIWIAGHVAQVLDVVLWAAIFLGISTAVVVISIGIMWILIDKGVAFWLKHRVCKPAGLGVARGAIGFKDVMRIGYVSVKSNTCPRVVISDEESTK